MNTIVLKEDENFVCYIDSEKQSLKNDSVCENVMRTFMSDNECTQNVWNANNVL